MGLTIHYQIAAPPEWAMAQIRTSLEGARRFALSLRTKGVSDLAEFLGEEADCQKIRDAGLQEEDPFFWAKCHAGRTITNPWRPGVSITQPPDLMLTFMVHPAHGCEPFCAGACSYANYVWPRRRNEDRPPAWSLVFDKDSQDEIRESRKLLRQIMRRWRLMKLPKASSSPQERFGGTEKTVCRTLFTEASIQRGKYLSRRKGRAGCFGLARVADEIEGAVYLKHTGSADEAERDFADTEFQADMERLAVGEDYIAPAASGVWQGFVKTQYANDPRAGGWENFVKGHLSVLAILERLQQTGFKVMVQDEGEFWETRSFEKLAKSLEEYDARIAGLGGALKDMTDGAMETAMDGRPGLEYLEAKGQEGIGEWLDKLRDLLSSEGSSDKE